MAYSLKENLNGLVTGGLIGVATVLTGCESSSEALNNSTITCFDYTGNEVFKTHEKGHFQKNGVVVGDNDSFVVSGGGGCIIDEKASEDIVRAKEAIAPLYVIVTDGASKIQLAGKFDDVSAYHDSARITLTLDGAREVVVNGPQVLTSKDKSNFNPDIFAASGLK